MSVNKLGFWGAVQGIIQSGLVLHLDAGDPASYPGSGSAWNDLSPSNNDGTLVNGVGFNSGVGGHLTFDGTNDYVELAQSSTTMALDYITISAWVKANASTKGWVISGGFDGTTGSVCFHLNVGGNASALILDGLAYYDGAWKNSDIATDIRGDGNWHFVTGTFNGTQLIYYLDGVSNSSTTITADTLPKNSLKPRIGNYVTDAEYFGGSISQVHIYNRALSAAEVLANYNATKSRFGL